MGRPLKGTIGTLIEGERYRVRVYIGRDRNTGLPRYKTEVVRGTLGDAERRRDALVATREELRPRSPSVGRLVADWFEQEAKERVKEGRLRALTRQEYARVVKQAFELAPGFRDRRADELWPQDLRKLYAHLGACMPGGGAHWLRSLHGVLRQVLRRAFADGTLPRDPTVEVRVPGPTERKPHRALTPEENERLLAELRQAGPRGLLLEVALALGLRPSEAIGLRLEQLDLERGLLEVNHRVRRNPAGGFDFDVPKSKSSRRMLAIPASLLPRLEEQRDRAAAAPAWKGHALLFPAGRGGGPLDLGNLGKRVLHPACARAGIGHLTLHGLRHTCATALVNSGAVLITQAAKQLGHSDPALTARLYVHPLEADRATAAWMDRLLRSVPLPTNGANDNEDK